MSTARRDYLPGGLSSSSSPLSRTASISTMPRPLPCFISGMSYSGKAAGGDSACGASFGVGTFSCGSGAGGEAGAAFMVWQQCMGMGGVSCSPIRICARGMELNLRGPAIEIRDAGNSSGNQVPYPLLALLKDRPGRPLQPDGFRRSVIGGSRRQLSNANDNRLHRRGKPRD